VALEATYKHSHTSPVRGREIDVNFVQYGAFIDTIISGTSVFTLPAYANNAAALAGGLVAGNLYRTGADPDTVCVVH